MWDKRREAQGTGWKLFSVYKDALAQSIVLKSEVIGTQPVKQTLSPRLPK